MPGDRQGLRRALHAAAFQRAGYFTAAQALATGYSYQAQKYHVDHGNWVRVDRGLFRLPDWPPSPDDTYVRWTIWSKDRAVVSHDSALSVHDLSDVDPARPHLSVPPDFHARSAALILHVSRLAEGDVEWRPGWAVTTVLRTLLDVAAGDLSQEHVDSAVADALARDLASRRQLLARADEAGDRAALRIERALSPGVGMTGDPRGLRTSVEARLLSRSQQTGLEVNRLRRHFVFQRMLARLSRDQRWVLKGGFALEIRLNFGGRATKDLDLALTEVGGSVALQDLLDDVLGRAADDDGLEFRVSRPRPIASDEAGAPGWRVTVTADMAGREFQSVVVDVVARPDEIAGGVEALVVEPVVTGLDLSVVRMPSANVAQHAAEKFHAMARQYAGDRPSSRVKDLVDLVLLIEAGLLPDNRLGQALDRVYRSRESNAPPSGLPAPPAAWLSTYPALATEVGLAAVDLDDAFALAAALYADAVTSEPHPIDQEQMP